MKPIAVITTVGSIEDARKLAQSIIERKLAACAQISAIESYYHWSGAVQNDPEFRILFKTTDNMYSAVEHAIREQHSYELPAIFALPVDQAYGPYVEWLARNSAGK